MRIIVDGYNLIRLIPELAALDRADLAEGRDCLIREISGYRVSKGHRITVVFDAGGSPHLADRSRKEGGVSVVYSGSGRPADDVIVDLCRSGGADLIVTADRGLSERAGREGVEVVAPRLFWERVESERYRQLKGVLEEDDEERQISRPRKKLTKKERRRRSMIDKL